jgi:hypothetical protein
VQSEDWRVESEDWRVKSEDWRVKSEERASPNRPERVGQGSEPEGRRQTEAKPGSDNAQGTERAAWLCVANGCVLLMVVC